MECKLDIRVNEPKAGDIPFRPYVEFRLEQLNLTPHCMTDQEIDWQISMLVAEIEKLRKKAKKALREARDRHDQLFRDRGEVS